MPVDPVATRRSLHAVAEHVLAPARYRVDGHIGLTATPGGFATPVHDGRQVRVEGGDLVVADDGERRAPLTTLGAAAAFVGVALGAPAGLYEPVTAADPDVPLVLDPVAAAVLADWFGLVDAALAAFAPEADRQLWPEHFDLAVTVDEVNYGGSPGDDAHDDPYLYVGPWSVPAGELWNEPWGVSWPASTVPDAAAAVGLLAQGRAAAAARP